MSQQSTPLLIGIYGPTASGKTALAERIADSLNAQLINADAFQMYRYFNIGTAKPENKERYHLIDVLDPTENCAVGQWVMMTVRLLESLWSEGRSAILVGGTGLYLRALFEQYSEMSPPADTETRNILKEKLSNEGLESLVKELVERNPELAQKTDLRNPVRVMRAIERSIMGVTRVEVQLPAYTKIKLALDPEKRIIDDQIERRIVKMMQNGWVQEVERILSLGYSPSTPAFRAIGYTEIRQYLEQEETWDCTIERIVNATRQYAKRQKTWLRSEPCLIRLCRGGSDDAVYLEAMERLKWAEN